MTPAELGQELSRKMVKNEENFRFSKLDFDKGWMCVLKRGPTVVEFVAKTLEEIPVMLDGIRKNLPLPEPADLVVLESSSDENSANECITSADEDEEGEDIESTDNEEESSDTELTEDKEFVSEHPDDVAVAVEDVLEILKQEEAESEADTEASDSASDDSSVYEPPPRRKKDAERKAFLESAPKIELGAKLLNVKVPRKRKPRGPKATKKKEEEEVSHAAAAGIPLARSSPASPLPEDTPFGDSDSDEDTESKAYEAEASAAPIESVDHKVCVSAEGEAHICDRVNTGIA